MKVNRKNLRLLIRDLEKRREKKLNYTRLKNFNIDAIVITGNISSSSRAFFDVLFIKA